MPCARYGAGSGSVRTIAGTMEMHMELERRLAAFKNVEAVVVFQSGFAANAGTVSAILTKDDVIISDELNHASIIDGCRLSRATIKVFPHKDVDAARKILQDLPAAQRKLLITDGVFSMDGDLGAAAGALRRRRRVRRDHDGGRCACERRVRRQGSGTVDHFGCHGRVDIQVGTLSKAIGVLGGYVAGTKDLHRVPLPPRAARSCSPPRIRPRWPPRALPRSTCSRASRSGWSSSGTTRGSSRPVCRTLGFNTGRSESPITPVIVGEAPRSDGDVRQALSGAACSRRASAFPPCARDQARLRTIVAATHTREDLQFALDMFGKVGRELGVI